MLGNLPRQVPELIGFVQVRDRVAAGLRDRPVLADVTEGGRSSDLILDVPMQ